MSQSFLNAGRGLSICLAVIAILLLLAPATVFRHHGVQLDNVRGSKTVVQRAVAPIANKIAIPFGLRAKDNHVETSSLKPILKKRALTYDKAVDNGKCHLTRLAGKGIPSKYT